MFRMRTDPAPSLFGVELVEDVLVVHGPDLDTVLAEVGERLGPDADVLDARREIVGGIAGFFGRERFTVEARSTAPHEPGVIGSDGADGEGPDGVTFAAELARALREVDELVAATEDPTEDPTDDATDEPALGPVRTRRFEPGADRSSPERGVVVVVGDGPEALASAEALAREHDIDPAEVLIVSRRPSTERPAWLTVTDCADAARRAARWRGRDGLTILAMPMEPGDATWSRDVLAALAPEQVRLARQPVAVAA